MSTYRNLENMWVNAKSARRSVFLAPSAKMKSSSDKFRSPQNLSAESGLTLIELLVTIGVIACLAAMGAGVYGKVLESGKQTREMGAGKSLISAYLTAAADDNGKLMVAHYEGQSSDIDNQQVSLPDGTILSGGTLHRYPYRLSPYFEYNVNGVLLVNDNKKQVAAKFSGSMHTYGVSLCPAFGINYYFVGGYVVDNVLAGADDCATRLAQVEKPSSLLVFATAFQDVEGMKIGGRFGIEPPKYRTDLWNENRHVDPRHDGKVLCVFLDGSIRAHTVDELTDMRLWSRRAAVLNDPNYTVAASGTAGPPGGGGRR